MKLKVLAFAISCLFLTACDDREGTLTVNSDLSLSSKKGRVMVPAGSYSAELEGKGDNEVQLEIKSRDKKIEVNFEIPASAMTEGDIFVSSEASGLGYDVAGHREVTKQVSEVRRTSQSCYLNDYPGYGPGCYYDPYNPYCNSSPRIGRQDIEYVDVTTFDNLHLNLQTAGANVASFTSDQVIKSRRTLYVGTCW